MLETAVLDNAEDFAGLEEEWEDLHCEAPLATPFQSWAWLYSWWESYGEAYELRLITLREEEGLLVGILPFMLHRRMGFVRLMMIGAGLTEYLDILAREGREDEVAHAAKAAMKKLSRWHVADFQQLRPKALLWRVFRDWDGPRSRVEQERCAVIEMAPWDELLASLKQKVRYYVRHSVRRAEEDGVDVAPAKPEDAERAARGLVKLHRETWRGREINPEHLSERFESHLAAAARRMSAHGVGGIFEFRRDGNVFAAHFLVFGKDFVGGYLGGAEKEVFRRYQMSSLFISHAFDVARSRDSAYLDLLRGEEPYKLQWNPDIVANHRAILGRGRAFWTPYAGYHSLRHRAKIYVNSESAPQWLKDAVERYRSRKSRSSKPGNQGDG